jgi:hypothetical protein
MRGEHVVETQHDIIDKARQILRAEADALAQLVGRIDL